MRPEKATALPLDRRQFLQASAALGGSVLLEHAARAATTRIDAPQVDRIVVREVADGAHDIFLRGSEAPGLSVQRTAMTDAAEGRTLHSEWGLALHIESYRGGDAKQFLLDFGFTPEAYANNLDLLKIDPALVGGFHLAPAPDDYLHQVMAELKKFDLEQVLPMHCSGQNFIDLAKQEMPEKLVLCTTGSRYTFTA